MKTQRLIDRQYMFGMLLLPFVVLALAFVIKWIQGFVIFEPAYFTAEYQERYEVPNGVLMDAEAALRQGDAALMARLQGMRRVPKDIEPLPDVRFLAYWDQHGKYLDFLYMDTSDSQRYKILGMLHLKSFRGRYISVPEGFYYYLDSGRWLNIFGPSLAIWWLILILFTIGVWIYRTMDAVRNEMYGPRPRLTK